MSALTHAYTYTHILTHAHTHTHTNTHTYTYTYAYTHRYSHTRTHTYTHIHTHAHSQDDMVGAAKQMTWKRMVEGSVHLYTLYGQGPPAPKQHQVRVPVMCVCYSRWCIN